MSIKLNKSYICPWCPTSPNRYVNLFSSQLATTLVVNLCHFMVTSERFGNECDKVGFIDELVQHFHHGSAQSGGCDRKRGKGANNELVRRILRICIYHDRIVAFLPIHCSSIARIEIGR